MKTDAYASNYYEVGHMGKNGVLYSDPAAEIGTEIGHISADGVVYSQAYSEIDCAVGHVDADGIIYSEPCSEVDCAIGHVGADGVLYSEPISEVGTACLLLRDRFSAPTDGSYAEYGGSSGSRKPMNPIVPCSQRSSFRFWPR